MNSKKSHLMWMCAKAGAVFGLLWLARELYPSETWNWLVLVTLILVFEWFVQPSIERWLKATVKQAIREKQWEDDEYAQSEAINEEER